MNSNKPGRATNLVFVLQLRQELDRPSGLVDPLRIILQDPQSGDHHSFPSLEQLTAFLARRLNDEQG